VSRQLSLIRRIALAKDQRALKPSAAPSFAQTQTKSWISSDVAVLGSNSINSGNWVIAEQILPVHQPQERESLGLTVPLTTARARQRGD
jgi:hypothetical protein